MKKLEKKDDMTDLTVGGGRYKVLNRIGSSSHGKMYLGSDLVSMKQVAIKMEPIYSHRSSCVKG